MNRKPTLTSLDFYLDDLDENKKHACKFDCSLSNDFLDFLAALILKLHEEIKSQLLKIVSGKRNIKSACLWGHVQLFLQL